MAGRIKPEFIERLQQRADIVEIIGRHVKLKANGHEHVGLCPFHDEKTPSFQVNADKQLYYCFGCGAKGNLLSFLMDFHRRTYVEAIEQLAADMAMPIEYESGNDSSERQPTAPVFKMLEDACDYYVAQLQNGGAVAFDYLRERGINQASIEHFRIGYAPPQPDNLLNALGGDAERNKLLMTSGLLKQRSENPADCRDLLRQRILFPIRNTSGRIIGFGGRRINPKQQPKYLNTPSSPVFHKKGELFGLYEALRIRRPAPDSMILTEGYLDVIMLAQHGITNAVATMGTSVSTLHLQKIFRYVPTLYFCFDGDEAGKKAAERALKVALTSMRDGLQIYFLFLPDGQDPDSLVRSKGSEYFRDMLSRQSLSLSKYFLNSLQQNIDLNNSEGRAKLLAQAKPFFENMEPSNYRELLIRELAALTKLDQAGLSAQFRFRQQQAEAVDSRVNGHSAPQKIPPHPGYNGRAQEKRGNAAAAPEPSSKTAWTPAQRLIRLLLKNPPLFRLIPSDCPFDCTDPFNGILQRLLEVLRNNPGQINGSGLLGQFHNDHSFGDLKSLWEEEVPSDQQQKEELLGLLDKLQQRAEAQSREKRYEELLARGETPEKIGQFLQQQLDAKRN